MSNWAMILLTGVIAYATWQMWKVYQHMSQQIEKQIDLTRDLFLESHAPILSVSIKRCAYADGPAESGLKGNIVIANHGTVAANQVTLNVNFGGFNAPKQISKIAIPPKGKVTVSLFIPMTAERYATGTGTRITSMPLLRVLILALLAKSTLTKTGRTMIPTLNGSSRSL